MNEQARLDTLPERSLSEIFVEKATQLIEEKGFDPSTEKGRKLRAEVIRHYEGAVRELSPRLAQENPDWVDRSIEHVNGTMRGWLDGFSRD